MPPMVRLIWVKFVHGDPGPVRPAPPLVPTSPICTSTGTAGAAVAVESNVNPVFTPICEAATSNPTVFCHSIATANTPCVPTPPEVLITTAVWPPTQDTSAHVWMMHSSVPPPFDATDAKLSALPPIVIPDTDGLLLVPTVTTATISVLPATVACGRFKVSVDAAAEPCCDWTSAGDWMK